MKKIISIIFLLVYVLTSNAQTMIDQRINLSGSNSLSLAIPSDFCYNKKPMLQLSKNENHSDETMFIYDENLNMVKTINTGQSKSFDYQLTYQDEVRDITEVFIKEEIETNNYHKTFEQFVESQKMLDPTFDESKLTITKEENGDSLIIIDMPDEYYYYSSYFGKQYPLILFRCKSSNMFQYRVIYGVNYGEWRVSASRTEDRHKDIKVLPLLDYNLNQGHGQSTGYFKVSQTLFNTDEDFEYLMPKYVLSNGGEMSQDETTWGDEDRVITTRTVCTSEKTQVVLAGFQVVSSDGNVLHDLNFDADFVSSDNPSKIYVLSIGSKTYLVFTGYKNGSEYTAFYLVNREATNVQKVGVVKGGMSVIPTIANSNTPINISFNDDNKDGSKIKLYSTTGSLLQQQWVPAEERSTQITIGNNPGVYVIERMQTGEPLETRKIIIK